MCEECRKLIGHDPRCPHYIALSKTNHKCCYCDEYIDKYEKFAENDGEYVHIDCIPNIDWLLDWLNVDVREIDDEYSEYES